MLTKSGAISATAGESPSRKELSKKGEYRRKSRGRNPSEISLRTSQMGAGGWQLRAFSSGIEKARIPVNCRICTWSPVGYPVRSWRLKFGSPICEPWHGVDAQPETGIIGTARSTDSGKEKDHGNSHRNPGRTAERS